MKNNKTSCLAGLVIALTYGLCASSAFAANTWTGGGASTNWSDNNNWGGAQPGYGTLTFTTGGTQGTTSIVDQNYNMNMLLWTGSSSWTVNNSGGFGISLFDNGGTQAKIENQSSGTVTINAPITFAATAGAAWGEINAVNGDLTFGSGTLTVNGSAVNYIKMFGGGRTTTFNNTVSASGKAFYTTSASGMTMAVGGAFTSGDIFIMNGSTLNLNSGGSISTSQLRLGGDFGTTLTQNQTLGATFALTNSTGGQSFSSGINAVAGNTSNALLIDSQNTSGTNTLSSVVALDAGLKVQQATGGNLTFSGGSFDVKAQTLTVQGGGTTTINEVLGSSLGAGGSLVKAGTGTLILQGTSNNYTGTNTGTLNGSGTQINGGTLGIYGDTSLGLAPTGAYNNIQFTGNGTLQDTSGNISLNSNRNISVAAGQTATFDNNGNTFTIPGIISGATGSVSAIGSGNTVLSGVNTFGGGLSIKAGTVTAQTSNSTLGGTSGTVTLGNTTGTSAASLLIGTTGLTYANPIVLATNATVGTLTIGNTGTAISTIFTGGVTGTNNFTINSNATSGTIQFNSAAVNNSGTVTNTGAGTGTTTIAAIGSNVTGVTSNSTTSALTVTALTVNSVGTTLTNAAGTKVLTVTNQVTGTGNLTTNNNSTTNAGITFTNGVNNIGAITNSGTGTGSVTISSVGSNVTGVTENSTTSALTVTTLNVNSGGTTLTNTAGTKVLTVTNSVAGTGNLILNNNSTLASGITLTGGANNTGTILNSGSGSGSTTITGVVGTNINGTGVTQNASGTLALNGLNTFTTGLRVIKGTVSSSQTGATGFGNGAISLGNTTGGNSDVATILYTGGSTTMANAITVNAGSSGILSIQGQTNNAGFTGPVTLNNALTLANLTAAKTTTLSGQITGSSTISIGNTGITNTGIVAITGPSGSSYTGATTVNTGILNFASGGLGNGSANITLAGGTLQYASGNTQDVGTRLRTSGANALKIDINGNNVIFGTAMTDASLTQGLTLTSTAGGGSLTLTGSNTYTGLTTLTTGTLKLAAGGGTLNSGNALTTAAGGTFDVNGNSQTLGAVNNAGTITNTGAGTPTLTINTATGNSNLGAGTFGGTMHYIVNVGGTAITTGSTFSNTGNLTLNTAGGSITVAAANNSGTVTNSGTGGGTTTIATLGSGVSEIIQSGSALLTVNGNNNGVFTGNTTINSNTLNFTTQGLGNGSGTITFGGGTLQYAAAANTFDVGSRLRSSGANTVKIDVNNNNVIFGSALSAANIAGSGGLTLTSSTAGGSLTLTGTNTYTGLTTVTSGSLKLAAAGATLNSGNALTTASGTTFDINGNSQTLGLVNNGGTVTNTGAGTPTLTIGDGSTGAGTYTGAMNVIWNQTAATSTVTKLDNAGTFTYSGTGGVGTISKITGNVSALTMGASSGPLNITFGTAGDVVIGAGGATWTNNSASALTVSTGNTMLTYNGQLTLKAGIINFSNNSGATQPAGAGGVTIDGASVFGAQGTANASSFGPNLVTLKSGSLDYGPRTLPNDISFTGNFTMLNSGSATYTGANKTTTGNISIKFQDNPLYTGSSSTVTFTGGALVLGGDLEIITVPGGDTGLKREDVNLTSGISTGAADRKLTLTLYSGATLTVGKLTLGGNLTIDGVNNSSGTPFNGGLDTGGVARTITFNNTGAGVPTLSGALTGTASTITLAGSSTNAAIGALTGGTAHALDINSTTGGSFLFNGASTFTGGAKLTQGTLTLGVASVVVPGGITSSAIGTGTFNLGSGTNAATLQSNVTAATTRTLSNNISMDGDVTFATTTSSGRIALNVLNGLTTANTIVLTRTNQLTTNTNVTVDLIGAISGSGFGITKLGPGTLNLGSTSSPDTVANTYNGLTTVSAGNVTLNKAASTDAIAGNLTIDGTGTVTLGANNENINDASTVTVNAGGTLAMNAKSETVGSLVVAGGTVSTGTGTLTTAGAGSVTVGSSSGTSLVSSALVLGSGGLLINPSGTGAATVSGGVTSTGSSTNATISNSGSGSVSISAVNNQGTLTNNGTGTNTTTISGVIGTNVTSVTQNSATSQLTLSGTNTYTGPTNITAGTLQLGNGSTTGAISTSSTITDNGTFAVNRSNTATQGTDFGTINGSGGLTQMGAGTTVLTATNGYTGPTLVNSGTLQLGNGTTTGTIDTASAITTNATFSTNRSNTVTQGTDFSGSAISGTGGVTNAGSGILVLNAANSYSGVTSVSNSGTLQFNAANNLGNGSATNTVSLKGTLESTSGTYDLGSNRTINLTGVSTIKANSGALTLSGTVNTNTSSLTMGNAAGDIIISGELMGSGNLAASNNGGGSLTLSHANPNFTGNASVSGGQLMILTDTNALQNSNLRVGNGSLRLVSATGGTFNQSGTWLNNGASTIDLSSTGSSQTFSILGDWSMAAGASLHSTNSTANDAALTVGNFSATGGTATLEADTTLQVGNMTSSNATATALNLKGAATGTVQGVISDGTAASGVSVSKVVGGSGTWVLSGNNTYTGTTSVQGGILSVASLNSVSGGSATSNLGAPITVANGTIAMGSAATTGQLTYTGSGETTDRVLNLAGGTGGAILDQAGTGLLKFTSNLTATGAGSKTLTLQGSTSGTGEIAGAIVDNGGGNTTSLAKSGTGTWSLSGNNTYTGSTTIGGGTLLIAGSGSINGTSGIALSTGGTFRYNSTTAYTGGAITNTGGSVTGSGDLGAITLGGTGTVDPGNSPGLLTAGDTDPTGGLDYNFEFTLKNTGLNYSAVENDVLRLTLASPFVASLGTGNVISLYLDAATFASLTSGDFLRGGFYTDNGDFLSSISGATIAAYYQDGSGSTTYNGNTYSLMTVGSFGISTVADTNFSGSGFITQFGYTTIPEPSTYAMLAGGLGALWFLRRRSKKS